MCGQLFISALGVFGASRFRIPMLADQLAWAKMCKIRLQRLCSRQLDGCGLIGMGLDESMADCLAMLRRVQLTETQRLWLDDDENGQIRKVSKIGSQSKKDVEDECELRVD